MTSVVNDHQSNIPREAFKAASLSGSVFFDQRKLADFMRHIATKELSYQAGLVALTRLVSKKDASPHQVMVQASLLLEEAAYLHQIYSKHYHHPTKRQAYYDDYFYLQVMAGEQKSFELLKPQAPKASSSFIDIQEMQRTTYIREMTAKINWYRLFFLIRLRRFFSAVGSLESVSRGYKSFVSALDKASPALSYLGWIFYVPRFLVNVCLLIKHTIEENESLSWQQKAKNELSKRWFELANDGVWLTVGLINCFLLTGHAALFLTVGLYLFDVVAAVGQSAHRLSNYSKALSEISNKQSALAPGTDEYQALELRKNELLLLRQHEIKKIKVNIGVTSGLFICMGLTALALTMPTGIGIGVMVAAALVTLIVCLVQKHMQQKLDKEAPCKASQAMKAHGLFKQNVATEVEKKPRGLLLSAIPHSSPIDIPGARHRRDIREEQVVGRPPMVAVY